jgi:ComF family protein
VGCGRVGALLCDGCRASLERNAPILDEQPLPPIASVTAIGAFAGTLQQAVHALKYEGMTDLAEPLGGLLAARLRAAAFPLSLIVPVPLHANRLAQRGYNQSALLGRVLSTALAWPFEPALLLRQRATASQVGLNYQGRQENVRDAFTVTDSSLVEGRDILLVDDVYTTGATLRECALKLEERGARTIRAAVVGRAGSTGLS